jgi:glyoxylase-like metal-dependent hydrolase (beta-lactamase superfamily II)
MLMFSPARILATAAMMLTAAAATAQTTIRPMPAQVAPDSYMVQGLSALGSSANRNFISNAAFVVTKDGVLVIDALGSPALARELLAEIRRITPAPVRYVVLTHYHADHIYGLQVFKEAGATVIAHQAGREYLNSDTAALRLQASREEMAPAVDAQTRLVPADRWIDARTTLQLGGLDFVLQPAGPAHTPEDLVVWVPQLKLLFAGDLVFRGRVPFVGQADSGRWITALDTLLAFDARVIVPGHGPASTSARADLELTRDYLTYLRKTMGEAARNMDPFEEAYARTDWSRFDKLPLFNAANRINAYNTYLLMEQAAK